MSRPYKYKIGDIIKTEQGYNIIILENIDSRKIKIKFLDEYGCEKIIYRDMNAMLSVENPYHPTVCGIGYFGVGNYKASIKKKYTKAYNAWRSMLSRCYGNVPNRVATYKNVTVCEEWHNFQNFAKWYEENFPSDIKDINFELDKDFLQFNIENKTYSPETCVFLPEKINCRLISKTKEPKSKKEGVCLHGKKWRVDIKDFPTSKNITLGYFLDLEVASNIYNEYKIKNLHKIIEYIEGLNYININTMNKIKNIYGYYKTEFVFEPDVFIMAIRYSISRKTFASITVIDNIKANIDFFPTGKLQIILRDVKSDLESYREYLDNCDVQTWENFIEYLDNVINERTNDGK